MLDALSATEAIRKIQEPAIRGVHRDAKAREAEMAAYAVVNAQFRQYLEHFFAAEHNQESRDILWAAAEKWGGHNGYTEIQELYKDYAELNDEELKNFKY